MEETESVHRTGGVSKLFREPYFYVVLVIPAIIAAFWKTYFAVLADPPATLTPAIHVHFLIMSLWILMLVTQVVLILRKKLALHRAIGRTSFILAPLVLWTGLIAMHGALVKEPRAVTQADGGNLVLALGQLLAFALTWGLAIVYRKRRALHARFMVSTIFAMGTAIFFRIYAFWLPGVDPGHANFLTLSALVLALIANDLRLGMKWSPYWCVLGLNGLAYFAFFKIAPTDGWLAFVNWFEDLPGWIFFESPFG